MSAGGKNAHKERTPVIKLGWLVRDVISGLEGIAVARTTNLDGTTYITIVPACERTDRYPEEAHIAEYRLEKVHSGIARPKQRKAAMGFKAAIKDARKNP